ncbi:hypothetical protein [Flavobacterium sp. N2820]|uniref:hypothetical protein n=1 Tax=Flavobacterium sp. N2820 TaxID=2986834 RepID=UPI0022242E6D|nr:hypothetical protein [Flavobacterium sp. N2820]
MQKEIYFRIIELENHQVLLQKSWNEDDDKPSLIFTFNLKSCCINKTHSFTNEISRDKVFDTFTDEQAQNMIDSTSKLFD